MTGNFSGMIEGKAYAFFRLLIILIGLGSSAAHAHLQCVPYAREVSGISIHGDAHTWWSKADGRYAKGRTPEVGAILAFRPSHAMPLGHVAVVAEVLDDRRIVLNHANWSGPGVIEDHAIAVDVSEAGDWSSVRVWYGPIHSLGSRHNPTFGFIYDSTPDQRRDPITIAAEEASLDAVEG